MRRKNSLHPADDAVVEAKSGKPASPMVPDVIRDKRVEAVVTVVQDAGSIPAGSTSFSNSRKPGTNTR